MSFAVTMEFKIQLVAIIGAALLFLVVFELVRRRRLLERYALLWLFSALILLALAIWRGLLETLSEAIGVFYPPNALFLVAFGFVLVLLLHFSAAVSRLTDQSKVLAQRLAMLDERLRSIESNAPGRAGRARAPSAQSDPDQAGDQLEPVAGG